MPAAALDRTLIEQRLQLPLWVPVLTGCGIAAYFAWPAEPPAWSALALPLVALAAWRAARHRGYGAQVLGIAATLLAAGFALAMLRAHAVAAPVLAAPAEITLEGRVLETSRSWSGAKRLLLDRLHLHGRPPADAPERARVTLLPEDAVRSFRPGTRVMLHARISPPGGPVEPGGFDFRRMAWFDRLGAIGFARGIVLEIDPIGGKGPVDRARLALAGWRAALSEALRTALPGETGSFAAAILVGDRAGLPEDATAALRASNLAHLLAISGLHMGLLTGFAFFGLRAVLALIPWVALRWPTKRIAAVAAMAAGLAYLALSGASVATQRSFIMVVIVFVAVLIDRPAISLRSVALAAVAILILTPESLVEVGFQMSFAATAALVATYEALRRNGLSPGGRGILRGAAALALTSGVAGLATAPISAANFHYMSVYGLPANLLAVPLMGIWIMPAGALAAPLAVVGLEAPALWAMGAGIDLVLAIARFFAGLEGSVRHVPEPGAPVLIPIALGGLWLCIWRGRLALWGLSAIAAGLVWWQVEADRPALIVAQSGRQIGLMGPEGRAVFADRRETWAVERWLEADGDIPDISVAARRPGLTRAKDRATGVLGVWTVELMAARRPDKATLAGLCRERVLLIAPALKAELPGACLTLTGADLDRTGAVSVVAWGDGLRLAPALRPGGRLWEGQ